MDARRYRRLQELFGEVVCLNPDDRRDAIERLCGDDPELRGELNTLLAEQPTAERFFAGLAARAGIAPPEAEAVVHAPGTRIGPWRLLSQIGRGGMGVVYEAERADGQFSMKAALKVVPIGLITPEAKRRFQRERDILARLDHPNIARLLDGGITTEGTPYLVMELVRGMPLDAYCDTEQLELEARLALFRQVCEAVAFAHRNLVVHRDLKPSNVLVDRDGRPRLLDFGIARLMAEEDHHAVTAAMGAHPVTPAYCAPEVMTTGRLTTAADVYSLGVILFRLLTGRLPLVLEAATPQAWARMVAESCPPLASRVIADRKLKRRVRGDLDSIVARALRKEPERRYLSADAMAADLDRHEKRLPVRARRDSFRYHAARFVSRYRAPVAVLCVVFSLAVGGALALAHYAAVARDEAEKAAREGRRAQAVAGFLTEVFSAADPYERAAGEPTAGELLDRGLARIEHSELDPESRAQVLVLMARIYRRLSRYEDATVLLERARELTWGTRGANAGFEIDLLLEQAAVEYESGALDVAAGHAREGLEMLRGLPAADDARAVAALYQYGVILQEQGEYDQALSTLRSALSHLEKTPEPDLLRVAMVLDKIGFTLEKMTRYPEARDYYQRAIEAANRQPSGAGLHLAEFRNDLGRVLWYLENYEAAADQHRKVLAIRHERLGPDHRATGISHNNLGVALYSLGRTADGMRHVEAAVRIHRAALGEDHWLTAREKYVLSIILADLGEHERADQLFDEAYNTTKAIYGRAHRDSVMMLPGRAYTLNRRGDYGEAERLAREALSLLPELGAAQERYLQFSLARLVVSLAGQGRLEEAETAAAGLCLDQSPSSHFPVTAYTNPCAYAHSSLAMLGESGIQLLDTNRQTGGLEAAR